MFDLQNIYHTGVCVDDFEASKRQFARDLNLEWTETRTFDPLPFWTPEKGLHEIVVTAAYSRQGPHHLELCKGPKNSLYDPAYLPDNRHIGVWVEDLPAEAEKMLSAGWTVRGSADAPDNGFGILAYMTHPVAGLVIELVSAGLKPVIDEWLATRDT